MGTKVSGSAHACS